jgi:branched-chain amino acid transport system permease protein
MDYFLALLGSGVAIGAIYGLAAMGFAIVYKATGVINFAHGEMIMLVTYLAFTVNTHAALPLWLLLPAIALLSLAVGLLLEWVFIRPMIGEPPFSTVMLTIGLAVVLRSLVVLIWGAEPHPFGLENQDSVMTLGALRLYAAQVYAIGALMLWCVVLALFLKFSKYGIAMRATAINETTAMLMGVSVKRVYAMSWAIGALMAATVGVFFATIYELGPDMHTLGLRAFPAAILGGLDSVIGAAIGGIAIGALETLTEGYIGKGLKEIVGFAAIIVVLMVRPYGLFGQKKVERV